MPDFNCIVKKDINGFEISLFDLNLNDQIQREKLEEYIKNKIRKMKLNDWTSYEYLCSPNLSEEYKEKLKERIKQINAPIHNSKSWFDARRSRVTEFMAELLLKKKCNCIFYDEADKRINLEPAYADKHVPGIDVTGIYKCNNDKIRFVACEVKASKDNNIPCSSSNSLLEDIRNGYNNKNERVSREILQYISYLSKIESDDKILQNVIEFLTQLIKDSSSMDVLLKNVIFIPFMIRNNDEIIKNMNLDDMSVFNSNDLKDINLKGIIWSFNEDIDSFCINIYDEVCKNA